MSTLLRTAISCGAALALASAAAPAASAAAAPANQRCADVVVNAPFLGATRFLVTKNRHASCKSATAIVQQFWTGPKRLHNASKARYQQYYTLAGHPGWRCGTGAGAPGGSVGCTRGRKFLSGEGYQDAGSAQLPSVIQTFEQGLGLVKVERPQFLGAKRNVRPGSNSGQDTLGALNWTGWGGPSAVATGNYWWWKPDGSDGILHPITVALDGGILCDGTTRAYTRLTTTFTATRPPKFARTLTQTVIPEDCAIVS